MPNIKNYTLYFTTMTLTIEKKITQLLNYVGQFQVSQPTVGDMQERMLMDFIDQLREALGNANG